MIRAGNDWELNDGDARRCGPLPLYDLTRHGIPGLRRELKRRGIALVQVEPGDVEGRELRGIVSTLGTADSHHGDGCPIWPVRPTHAEYGGARSLTMMPFPFHTDGSFEDPPPRYIALYVVREDREGGGTTLVLAVAPLLNRVSDEARHILGSTKFRIRVPTEFDKGVPHRDLPVLLDNCRLRYRREIIDATACTPAQVAAMDRLDDAIASADPMRLQLRSGMILLLDNALFLHARTEVRDRERHLLRMRFNIEHPDST
jgi:alpha-ketoglutarate-dependent taurine dioxygenase